MSWATLEADDSSPPWSSGQLARLQDGETLGMSCVMRNHQIYWCRDVADRVGRRAHQRHTITQRTPPFTAIVYHVGTTVTDNCGCPNLCC